MQQKYIENIIQANNDNRLAIFVGAGITKNCETDTVKVPLWEDLIEEMKNDLSTKESDFLKIAELYFLEFGGFTYFEKLKAFFTAKLKPTEIHKKIFELNPNVVITTNWDNVLETTIDENAHIYDVVHSDKDLVKSTLQKKLIKMHGDFTANNLIFKESDYLNYSNHFPIIENYVKSILSTHTVLFLGYSYSDYNLKQIMKWLQHHSDIQPPRYLTQFEDNKSQTKYLSAHGITTMTLANGDSYADRLVYFLKTLNKNSRNSLINYLDKPEQFILKRLSIFAGLNRILFEQIRKVLTNCYFFYDKDGVILQFCVGEVSFDQNEEIREIYKGFVKYLTEVDDDEKADFSPETKQIFDIFSRANIKGITLSRETGYTKYVPIIQNPRAEAKYYNFEPPSKTLVISSDESTGNLMHKAFAYYQQQDYEQAYKITEEVISKSRKERAYVHLFIAMHNRNHLLMCLESDLVTYGKFTDIEKYDLEETYLNLPRDVREVVKPIYEFVSFNFLYELSHKTSVDLREIEKSSQTKQRGGLSFRADVDKTACLQNNLLCFVFANTIMLEEYQEFKHFNQQAFEIALMKQAHLNEFSLTKVELFSAINFLKFKSLTKILVEQYENNNKRELKISDEAKKWLIETVMPQNLKLFQESVGLKQSRPSNRLRNVIYILSLVRLDTDEIEIFLEYLNKLVNTTISLMKNDFQELTGSFVRNQEVANENSITAEILEKVINEHLKALLDNTNELKELQYNYYDSLYSLARQKSVSIDDGKTISALLNQISQYSTFEQTMISRGLLFSLADVSEEILKGRIFDFIQGIPLEELGEGSFLLYSLDLEIYDLKIMDNNFITRLESHLTELENGNSLGSDVHDFRRKLDYLYNKNKLDKYQNASEIAKRLSNKMREIMSGFSLS